MEDTSFQNCMIRGRDGLSAILKSKLDPFANRPGREDTRFWKPLKLQCLDPPAWISSGDARVSVQIVGPSQQLVVLAQKLMIEPIQMQQTATIGACVGPLFSAAPTLHDWMYYHRDMQVSEFHIYVPHGKFIDSANYSREAGSHPGVGLRATQRATPFYSSVVSWHHFWPMPDSYYFAQMTIYNECVFRNRHRYQYLVLIDVDEFLVMSNGTLLEFLEHQLTASTAGILLPISWHAVTCPRNDGIQTYIGYDPFADRRPDMQYFDGQDKKEWYGGSKSVVRPLNVVDQHVHVPLIGTPNVADLVKRILPSEAAMKHVRCSSWSASI